MGYPSIPTPEHLGHLGSGGMGEQESGSGIKTRLDDSVVRSKLYWFLFVGLMVLKATCCAALKLFLPYVQSINASDLASTARAPFWPCLGAPLCLDMHWNPQGCFGLKVKQVLKCLGGWEAIGIILAPVWTQMLSLLFFLSLAKCCSYFLFVPSFHQSFSGFFQAKWFFLAQRTHRT